MIMQFEVDNMLIQPGFFCLGLWLELPFGFWNLDLVKNIVLTI